jgi:uncharacterized membrane protein
MPEADRPVGGKMGLLRYQLPSGERRFWSFRDIVRGRSIGRPTHPIFVIFPLAFFTGAAGLDILSRLGLRGAPLAATYAVVGGLIGSAFAIPTGLLDRARMRAGSRVRAVATRHMYIQFAAVAVFVVDLAVRWSDRHQAEADPLWMILSILGVAVVIIGGDAGFNMVFRMGVRVSDDGSEPAEPAEPARAAAGQPEGSPAAE